MLEALVAPQTLSDIPVSDVCVCARVSTNSIVASLCVLEDDVVVVWSNTLMRRCSRRSRCVRARGMPDCVWWRGRATAVRAMCLCSRSPVWRVLSTRACVTLSSQTHTAPGLARDVPQPFDGEWPRPVFW
jgi:hypothetical protein